MQVILQADQRPKQTHKDAILPAHPQELYLLEKELGLMLNHKNIRSPIIQCRRNWSIFFVMEVYLETMMERLNSGELKVIFRIILCFVRPMMTKSGRAQNGRRRRTQENISVLYWFFKNNSLLPSSPRSFRMQSYWSFITGQCRDSGRFLQVHLSRRMCDQFTFHRIDTGRSKFEPQVFFLLVDPMDKNHKDPDTIDLEAVRLTQYMHKAWKKHQNTVYWVDITLAQKKGLEFYQTRSERYHFSRKTLPACCVPKVVQMETWEVIYEKVHASPRFLPKISLKND